MKSIFSLFFLISLLLTLSCESDQISADSAATDTGIAGSYARFLTVGNFMYIVDDASIQTFSLSDPFKPERIDQQAIGERIESIFHFEEKLFIGSGAGLFIYQIEADGIPSSLSATSYFNTFDTFACDPVVANSTHAYVTLNSLSRIENPCGGVVTVNVNVLKIFDIQDLTNPILLAEYPMTAPKGLGLDGDILFVCDDAQGLKVFDVSDPLDIELMKHFDGFTAFDVITLDGLLLVVSPDNVYQFDYNDLENIRLVSEIPYGR